MTTWTTHFLRSALAVGAALALAGAAAANSAPAAAGPEPAPATGPMGRVLVGEGVQSYMRMDSMRTALLVDRRSGSRATLEVAFSLDAPERDSRRMIEQRRLWLRAAYSETLLIYAGRMYRWGEVPDLDRLAQLLQEDTDRLIGPGRAQVLLDTVLISAS
ncbi:hypothetical protein ACWCOP_14890 [Maricaulaceae bacterium MS644]